MQILNLYIGFLSVAWQSSLKHKKNKYSVAKYGLALCCYEERLDLHSCANEDFIRITSVYHYHEPSEGCDEYGRREAHQNPGHRY